MARTAKQKRATAKLVALNKRRKFSTGLRRTSRRAYEGLRKSSSLKRRKSSRKPMARRRSLKTKMRSVRRRTDLRGIFKRGMLGELVKGIGAGTVAGLVFNQFAPQYSSLASTGAGYLGGGLIGMAGSLFVNGGFGGLSALIRGGSSSTSVNGGVMGV
jgi:hypothetical protein